MTKEQLAARAANRRVSSLDHRQTTPEEAAANAAALAKEAVEPPTPTPHQLETGPSSN